MKDNQITLRLPATLARKVARYARERGIPKSQVVREAIQIYLANAPVDAASAWSRVEALVGAASLDPAAIERDTLASQLSAHNWRE